MPEPESSPPFPVVPETRVQPQPISAIYRLGLVAVAVGLMLLPVAYFGLVAGIVWLVYLHIHHLNWYMEYLRGLWGLTTFAAPIFTGAIVVYFMSRPFFVRGERPPEAVVITPEQEPILFDFIHAISRLVAAPFPKRVYVDWQVNASASMHRGLRSFLGRELDLTIGLPLAAALTISQLGGVLAHEFGHFAQGAGMRFSHLIRTMNRWLARIAYQPRDLEESLAYSSFNQNLWGRIALAVARLGLWIARQTLHGLVMLGHAISCFSLRQMEFDADLYEAKVSGPDEFAAVIRQLPFLTAGWDSANVLLAHNLGNNRLPKDFSALTLARTEAAVDYRKREIEGAIATERSEWFSTHPSARERIERVRRTGVSGVIADPRPATGLFRDFGPLSEQVTLHYYRVIGVPTEETTLAGVEEICEGHALSPAKLAAVRAFFADRLSPDRPVIFGPADLTGSHSAAAELSLRQNREAWQNSLAQTRPAFERFYAAQQQVAACETARWLHDARERFRLGNLRPKSRPRDEIERCRAEAVAVLTEVEPLLVEFENAARRRLIDALRLPPVVPNNGPETIELAAALENFRAVLDLLPKLRANFAVYAALFPLKQSQSPQRKAHTLCRELAQTLSQQLEALNLPLGALTLPYGDRETMLSELRRRLPDEPLPLKVAVYRDVSVYLEEIDTAYCRVMGDLCVAARSAEAAVLGP